jgi:hypothetical protein
MNKGKKPFESKKFIALVVGATFTTVFTLVGLIIIALVPNVSSAVVNLMTVSLASLNSVIGIYALGQSVVDFKINSNHETIQENKISDQTKTLVLEQGKKHEFNYDDLEKLDWGKVKDGDLKDFNFNFNFNDDK